MTITKTFTTKKHTFTSFDEVEKIGGFNYGIWDWVRCNAECKRFVFQTALPTDLVLYYEGSDQIIPGGKDLYAYFDEKGYEVVDNGALLISAMKYLTEEKLTEMGIPTYVDIVLPTVSLLPYESGNLCFLEARRYVGKRKLGLDYFGGEWDDRFAFLLRKKVLGNPSAVPLKTLPLNSFDPSAAYTEMLEYLASRDNINKKELCAKLKEVFIK